LLHKKHTILRIAENHFNFPYFISYPTFIHHHQLFIHPFIMSSNPPITSDAIRLIVAEALRLDRATRSTSAAPTTSITDLVGTFSSTKRTDEELELSSMTILTKKDRDTLSPSDKNKIYTHFIKGIPDKELRFKAITSSSDIKDMMSIGNLESFMDQKQALSKHLTSISTTGVFYILTFDASGDLEPVSSANVNLLKAITLPSIENVVKSCDHHAEFGSHHNIENMKWSYDAIMSSCDKPLRQVLSSKMLKYPEKHYGPILFWFLMKQVTTVDDTIIRSITNELINLRITDIPGQSIAITVSKIRAAKYWLNLAKMTPPDLLSIVKTIMKTCSVPDFLQYLISVITNAELNNKTLDVDELLTIVEAKYAALVISGDYDLSTSGGSSFNANVVHEASRNRGNQRNTSNRNDRPRNNVPSWNRDAPADNAPQTREFESRTYTWCGTCGRWMYGDRGHLTSEHVVGHKSNRNNRNAPTMVAANNISDDSDMNEEESNDLASDATVAQAKIGRATRDYSFFTGGL
jgi:hypothetical protein